MADVAPPRKRRRLLKLSLAAVLVIAATAVALPIFGAPVARDALIDRLEGDLHAHATLDDLAFGLSGWARLSALGLEDLDGRPVLSLERADLSLGLIPALRGRIEGELVLDGLVVHLRRNEEGLWNVLELPRAGAPSSDEESAGEGSGDEEAEPLPDVQASLLVKNGHIIVHGSDGETELRDLTLEVGVPGAREPASFHLGANVHGPTGPGGRITIDGSSPLEPLASGASPASFAFTLEELLLEALEPALALALDLEQDLPPDTIGLEGEAHFAGGDLTIDRLDMASTMVRGTLRGKVAGLVAAEGPRFDGLAGELAYVPDRVAPLLAGLLPGKLSGAGEESITFELNGVVGEPDVASLLAATQGWATVGLGRFEAEGFDTSGDIRLELDGGVAVLLGTIEANGGSMRLKAAADLRGADDSASWLEVGLAGVQANAELAPLLGHVHPLLGAADALQASDLGGLIDCDLQLAYDGPLDLAALPTSWAEVPKEFISGSGSLSLSSVALAGSPLLERIASELGASSAAPMTLAPVRFKIRGGRLEYHEPWQWKIEGALTTFSGSVGLDETLALRWSVPITDDLVRRHGFLKPLLGESLEVPLEGTTSKPKLLFEDALSSLAKSALQAEVADRLGAELGGVDLGDLRDIDDIAETVGDLLGGKSEGKEDAATLYKRAGDLWDEGKKKEAGALYERIRKEYKNSAVYLLHRSKIKKRAKKAD